jgi:lipopolysaccharide transport system ATP-binding protein
MSDIVIRCQGLSKQYRIGERQVYKTFRDTLASTASLPLRRLGSTLRRASEVSESSTVRAFERPNDSFWALDEVSFEVKRGEVLGVIGRNGAGKSTLLKILSRITEPTKGRAEIHGRIGSLLEVGTGFNPELSGRENIYLNGAILGMKKAEIERRFDEMVAFAEVERFLDTPVKRYSSGMHVRLAFAVAAHLDPEILVVDEVLAVGDAEFQRKCVGKMGDVATRDGRTVIFVSHNMQAVRTLCESGLLLNEGRIVCRGDIESVANRYLSQCSAHGTERVWQQHEAPGNSRFRLLAVRVLGPDGSTQGVFSTGRDLWVEMEFSILEGMPSGLCVGFDLTTSDGVTLLRTYHSDSRVEDRPKLHRGLNRIACKIPAGLLNGGIFTVCPRVGIHNLEWYLSLDGVVRFELELDHGVSPLWNSLTSKTRPGLFAPILTWAQQAYSAEPIPPRQQDEHN